MDSSHRARSFRDNSLLLESLLSLSWWEFWLGELMMSLLSSVFYRLSASSCSPMPGESVGVMGSLHFMVAIWSDGKPRATWQRVNYHGRLWSLVSFERLWCLLHYKALIYYCNSLMLVTTVTMGLGSDPFGSSGRGSIVGDSTTQVQTQFYFDTPDQQAVADHL